MSDQTPTFHEIEGNPRPAGLTGGYLTTRDRRRLRYAIAKPERATRGTVVLLQGRNEAIEKYFETIAYLTSRGFTVAICDWRGQGGSDRHLRDASKGHIDSISTFVCDLERFVETVVTRDCRPPFVAIGHSMGGLVALAAVPRLLPRIERLVLCAPLVALPRMRSPGTGPLAWLTRILRWTGLSRLALRSVERSGTGRSIARNVLTSDARRAERNRRLVEAAPELFVRRLTAGWLDACFREMRRLDDSDVIAGLHLPTLVVTAGADMVVSSAAAERLAWRMRSGHHVSIPGARHELLQERDEHRELFLAAFEGFVGSVTPSVSDMAPAAAVAAELEALQVTVGEKGERALSD